MTPKPTTGIDDVIERVRELNAALTRELQEITECHDAKGYRTRLDNARGITYAILRRLDSTQTERTEEETAL